MELDDHPRALRVAAAQFAPSIDPEGNLRTISEIVASASGKGAAMVVLPEESMLTAWDNPAFEADVVKSWPAFRARISGLANRYDIWIVACGYRPATDGRIENVAMIVDRTGGIAAEYVKLHLYDAFDYTESEQVSPGSEVPPVVLVEGIPVGIMVCYDLRFPELARDLAVRGAEIICVPAAWVSGVRKVEHWRTLLAARAIENTAWTLGAGSTAPECIGRSVIIDPAGGVRAEADPTTDTVITADIDREELNTIRTVNPSLANRRYAPPVLAPRTGAHS